MVKSSLPLSVTARLGNIPYQRLYKMTVPNVSKEKRKDGSVYTCTAPIRVKTFRGVDGKRWIAADEINRLIESGVIADISL